MNQADRKQLEIAHLKLDDVRQDIVELKNEMEKAHENTEESLKFIKENAEKMLEFKNKINELGTAITLFFSECSFLIILATCRILSIVPTDVPPNFNTFLTI